MKPQNIGDIVEYEYAMLYFVLQVNETYCTLVKKQGTHNDWMEYSEDMNTTAWDNKYKVSDVPIGKIKLIKSIHEQINERGR